MVRYLSAPDCAIKVAIDRDRDRKNSDRAIGRLLWRGLVEHRLAQATHDQPQEIRIHLSHEP